VIEGFRELESERKAREEEITRPEASIGKAGALKEET
jgi:hypothetical protein